LELFSAPLESEKWNRKSTKKWPGYGSKTLNKAHSFHKYGRLKLLKGTFNQADPQRFQVDQAGAQCTAIAAMAICYAHGHPIKNWTSKDLDQILTLGDSYYSIKLGNKHRGDYLSPHDI